MADKEKAKEPILWEIKLKYWSVYVVAFTAKEALESVGEGNLDDMKGVTRLTGGESMNRFIITPNVLETRLKQ